MVYYDSEPVKDAVRHLGAALEAFGRLPSSSTAGHVALCAFRLKARVLRDQAAWEAYHLLTTHMNDMVQEYRRQGR